MQKPRKIPMRKCAGCGVSLPKRELIRVVRTPEGDVKVDMTGKLNGRGAYVCGDPKCFERMRKTDRLARVLETSVSVEVYDALAEVIAANGQQDE